MTGPSRMRAAAFLAAIALIGACRGTDTVPETYISFENPEIAAGLDSMRILGIRPGAGDTLPIHFWRHGEVFPGEAALPPALSGAFTLLAQGFKGGLLVYQSRSVIAGGNARKPVRDFRLEAPALTEVPVIRTARVGDAVVLLPSWETRPGYYRQTDTGGAESFTPEAEYAWTREGEVAGRDTVLRLAPIVLEDAGAYLFSASNLAGEDNQEFRLIVRHMLPRIAGIKPQSEVEGSPLTVRPAVARSDSLRYLWTKDGRTAGTDSVLAFPALGAKDTGGYQLRVSNASDSAETALSNRFTVSLKPDPDEAWRAEKKITAGAQNNSTHGTAIDLDINKDMLFSEAVQKQPLIDLVFVYSGAKHQLMSAVAAKRASDLTYAKDFDSAKLKDTRMVKVARKPAGRTEAWSAYAAGTKVSASAAAAGLAYLAQTTDGNLAWIRVDSIEGGTGASASVALTVAIAFPSP